MAVWLSGKAFAYFKELKYPHFLVLSTTKDRGVHSHLFTRSAKEMVLESV